MAKKIYMTSLKGGVGVTTCAVGLGIKLAEEGEKTLIVDGDRLSANALAVGGVATNQVYTLSDFARGACRAKQTLISHPKIFNLSFSSAAGLADERAAVRALDELDGLFDYVILDKIAKEKCDLALIVTEPYTPSIKCADICKAMLTDAKIKDIGLIVNKLNGGQVIDGSVIDAKEIASILRLPLKAVIPEDLEIPVGKWKKSTLRAFKLAAELIVGKREAVCNVCAPYVGINGFIKRKVRERL